MRDSSAFLEFEDDGYFYEPAMLSAFRDIPRLHAVLMHMHPMFCCQGVYILYFKDDRSCKARGESLKLAQKFAVLFPKNVYYGIHLLPLP